MRRTTKIMIGTYAATLVAVVATIGILSRSGYAAGRKQVREKFSKEITAEAPGVSIIILQAPEECDLTGELILREATGGKRPGMYSYPARMEAYLGKEVKGDTLFLTLRTGNESPDRVAGEMGRIGLTLYTGRVAEIVNGWRLHTGIDRLEADTLKLKTDAEVSLDRCNIGVFRVETLSAEEIEK